MKKNRKISKKMSVVTGRTVQISAIGLMLFVMVILNFLATSSCDQLEDANGCLGKQLERLEDERSRESARWDEMKTSEKLEVALLRHGLAMRYPKSEQVVRMKADGRPYAGQISVARANSRRNTGIAAFDSGAARKDTSRPARRVRR